LDDGKDDCTNLVTLAKLRLILTLTAILLQRTLQPPGSSEDLDQESQTILATCSEMMKRGHPSKSHMQHFLIRTMAKLFSKDLIKDWALKGIYSGYMILGYHWLMVDERRKLKQANSRAMGILLSLHMRLRI
jgi:hypothetical protein